MFFNKKYIKVNHNEEPEKTQAEEPKQEEAKEAAPVVETVTCKICKKELDKQRVIKNKYVCYECGYYFRVRTKNRIRMVADAGTFETWDNDLKTGNPLNFPEYEEKVAATQEKTGLNEGVTMGSCTINGEKTVLGVIDARFMMGSMGHVVGERITRAMEKATEQKLPVILFCCSGGARMQEGIISLMQMAKTSQAIKRHNDAGQLYVSVLTDPTTGGVTASFAMLGDIILAEPGALIGFAGPRVIEQTIGQKLPEGFQRSEFLLKKGFVDAIVNRTDLKDTLSEIVRMHTPGENRINTYEYYLKKNAAIERIPLRNNEDMTAWEKVQLSRSITRPAALDYVKSIFKDFIEFHGDRYYGDDGAIVGGIATIGGMPVTVIAQQKGKSTKENIVRNFGMPSPEGYRKALRLMKEAERFGRPVICFVDTPGAFCGIEAEERGQGEAIARNLYEMSGLKVPVLTIVIGEGGSGGALAMAVSNEVYMMENATYSILSPEGFASILWKDSKRAGEASEVMKITAGDLLKLKVIEKIIPEVKPAGEENVQDIVRYMRCYIKEFLAKYRTKDTESIVNERYERFRNF